MQDYDYPSLADFAETWSHRRAPGAVPYAHPAGPPILPPGAVTERLEELLDTVVSLQRADWLVEGVYAGPNAMGGIYRDVLHCARTLSIAVPPVIVSGCGSSAQGAFGTDDRPSLRLSSLFFSAATEGQRHFVAGRLCGHIDAHQVTWGTLYALIVDHDGLRRVARRNVGPALELFLAPLSLGARLGLSRWHRSAEITADRAGLLCCDDVHEAGMALLRMALATQPDLDPAEFLRQRRTMGADAEPGRWTEVLSAKPWLHKRLAALDLFARSEAFVREGGTSTAEVLLTDEELHERTHALLAVGGGA
ncbi:MAG: hypothetical protein EP330_24270 [Deltaproteobacteria bacterium]|nr:MAG: hypothetical protein EP330_24270 [Deltaproteobacteria bacterium]